MNGYVIGGYVVSIGSLSLYGASLAVRERAARRRTRASAVTSGAPSMLDAVLAEIPPDAQWSSEPDRDA